MGILYKVLPVLSILWRILGIVWNIICTIQLKILCTLFKWVRHLLFVCLFLFLVLLLLGSLDCITKLSHNFSPILLERMS